MTATETRDRRSGDLSRRELEVLRSVAKGLSNKDIGILLGIRETTVKVHLNNVYKKLGVNNRVRAALHIINIT